MPPAPAPDAIIRRWDAAQSGGDDAAAQGDDRVVRRRLLDVVRQVVPHDFYAFVLTDHRTTVGTSPLAEVPDLDDLPRVIRLKYRTALGRWTSLGPAGCTTLRRVTDGDLSRHAQCEEVMRPHAVTDVLLAVLRDRQGSPVRGSLLRPGADARREARSRRPSPSRRPHAGGRHAQLQGWLAALVPDGGARGPVPASAMNVGAQLLSCEAGVDAHEPLGRVAVAPGTWLTVRAQRLSAPVAGAASPSATSSPLPWTCSTSSRGRTDCPPASATWCRRWRPDSTRARWHAGSSSEHTVRDHLKSVFSRTGAGSRTALLARALGTAALVDRAVSSPEG